MRKTLKVVISLLIFIALFLLQKEQVLAVSDTTSSVPYETFTLGTGSRLVKTQTAFVPTGIIDFTSGGERLDLSNASDLFYLNGFLYIANSGSKQVVVADKAGNVSRIIRRIHLSGETINLANPTGVFADDNYIYIADKGNQSVYKVDKNDNCVLCINRPTNELYGSNTPYAPTKVAVQSSGTYYIVSEGTTTGVIEVNYAGEFVGFLGINTVNASFRSIVYSLFFGKDSVAASHPATPLNVALGEKSSVLTVNGTVNTETIKRLNINGVNTFASETYYPSVTLSDITMSASNYIYAVAETGEVFEYDRNGSLLFTFSVQDTARTQVLGLLSKPSAIVVDENDAIYLLDSSYNTVTVYQKTVFVSLVHQAMSLYNEGRYQESKPIFEEIIRQNTSFAKAHSALGMALYKEGNYDEALKEFTLAKDYQGYSSSFWEIRNIFIQNNSLLIVLIIIGIIALTLAAKILKKHTKIFVPLEAGVNKFATKKIPSECLYAFHILKHPKDTFYGIKRQKKAGFLSATIILLVFILLYVVNLYASGFLYRNKATRQGAIMNILLVLGIILLYIVMNFLISTLQDGEGKFRDIYVSTIYSLMPFIVLILPLTLLTHILTYNEKVIYTIYLFVIIAWCVINLVMSISEIHNFGFWETIKCILLTAFAMAIAVLFVLLIYTFLAQLIDFITSVVKEVIYRG